MVPAEFHDAAVKPNELKLTAFHPPLPEINHNTTRIKDTINLRGPLMANAAF